MDKELGTRYRAALGITELSDAIAVIVSEETGIISLAQEGKIQRHLDPLSLRDSGERIIGGRNGVMSSRGGGLVNSVLKDPKKRTGLKLISLIIAILLWLYVVSQGATTTPQELIKTPLKYHNLGEGLTVSGPDTVSLRIWGSLKRNSDTVAYVDLSGLGEGVYELPVNVKVVKGALFATVEPDKVEVVLKEVQEKELAIKYELFKPPSPAYEVLDIVITPEKCLLQGEEDAIKKVKTVKCQLSCRTEGITSFIPVAGSGCRGQENQ